MRSLAWFAPVVVIAVSGCGSGSGDSDSGSVTAVVQDLTLDPEGTTTVVSLAKLVDALTVVNFQANGGQVPVGVVQSGDDWIVTWNERVTPSHKVRVTGKSSVDNTYVDVSTSDSSAPTFAIANATQVPGLGLDTFEVQFSGVHVVEALAEDPASWTLSVSGQALDLASSSLDFDPLTQLLTITTGPEANLHASFALAAVGVQSVADVDVSAAPIAGSATGDSAAPTLLLAEQNLDEDEFGRVVDFTFSEAMDPVFSTSLGLFQGFGDDLSTSVTQVGEDVLRVSFNNPMLPGFDQVTLDGVMDCHGNVMATAATAIAAGSTVPNNFSTDPRLVTVSGAGGDFVEAIFDQALDPDDAIDPARWLLEVPFGNPIDLSGATFNYDLGTKTLLIEIAQDFQNGGDFAFGAMLGNEPRDVDGEAFVLTWIGTIDGDVVGPTADLVQQNRNVDPSGKTVDVSFSEDVELSSAENTANYSFSPGINVLSATRLAGLESVRLVLDVVAVPGDAQLDVSGVADLAGTLMAPQLALALTSTDAMAPAATSASAHGIEGADNDTLLVTFNDDMVEAEVEDPAHWTVQSPVGTALDDSNATIDYNAAARAATLVFDGGDNVHFERDNDFRVTFAGMRDVGGNVVTAVPVDGSVQAEIHRPTVESVWQDSVFANRIYVRFSEPCEVLDDIAGWTRYTARSSSGLIKGDPQTATIAADGLGVELEFPFALIQGSDTLDVAGVTDLAGNYLFPENARAIDAEDVAEPTLAAATVATTLSGEENDQIVVEFATRPSTWKLFDTSNWSVDVGGNPLDLTAAAFAFDGDLTVTIDLDGPGSPPLATGANVLLTVSNLISAQGVALSAPASDLSVASGDFTAPLLPAGKARLDAQAPTQSVLIEMNEAIDPADAEDTSLIQIGGIDADSAEQLGPRTVRATWNGGVIVGDVVQVDFRDLAGNGGLVTRAVSAADVAGPLVASVSGTSVPGRGGDSVSVVFNKPVDPATALVGGSYSVVNGSQTASLAGSTLRYASATHTVTIWLAAGVELDVHETLTVHVSGVEDHAGLVLNPPASVGGAIGGDFSSPSFSSAFVNWRESALGDVVEVRFSEDVDETFASTASNWISSGVATVMSVESIAPDQFRLSLSSAWVAGDELSLSGLEDLAGNAAATIAIQPEL